MAELKEIVKELKSAGVVSNLGSNRPKDGLIAMILAAISNYQPPESSGYSASEGQSASAMPHAPPVVHRHPDFWDAPNLPMIDAHIDSIRAPRQQVPMYPGPYPSHPLLPPQVASPSQQGSLRVRAALDRGADSWRYPFFEKVRVVQKLAFGGARACRRVVTVLRARWAVSCL